MIWAAYKAFIVWETCWDPSYGAPFFRIARRLDRKALLPDWKTFQGMGGRQREDVGSLGKCWPWRDNWTGLLRTPSRPITPKMGRACLGSSGDLSGMARTSWLPNPDPIRLT